MTAEWATASEAYRKQQKMDPIRDFEVAKPSGGKH
jgi:hypothetical protein